MSVKRAGFTVLELVVVLGLFAVVMASVGRVLVTQKRLYRELGQRADLSDNLRTAGDILGAELWGLDAGDGDILAIGSDSITIRAERALSFGCGMTGGALVVNRALTFGVRDFAVGDSILIYSNPDSAWRPGAVTSVSSLASCPDSVVTPVKAFEILTYRSYRAADGAYYIGVRYAGGLQPVAGPLVSSGLLFTYFDSAGVPVMAPRAVAAIRVRMRMQSAEPVTRRGATALLQDSLVTWITLRNNPRPSPR